MSLITVHLPRGGPLLSKASALVGQPVDNPPSLNKFTDEAQFITSQGKTCELKIIEDEDRKFEGPEHDWEVFSKIQRFMQNADKVAFLKNVCYVIPKIYFWFRPEVSCVLSAKYVVKCLAGTEDLEYIHQLVIKNPGLFDHLVPVFKITQAIYRTGGLKEAGIPVDLHRAIVLALVEVINLNRGEGFKGPALGEDWLKGAGCEGNSKHKKAFIKEADKDEIDFNLTSLHYVCFECGQLTLDAKSLKSHAKEHSKYACRTCELEFKYYTHKAHHVLTFCREPFQREKCYYCGNKGEQCLCSKFMAETVEIVENYLEKQQGEADIYIFKSDFFSAVVQHFNATLERKHLKRASLKVQNVETAIDMTLLPNFTLEGNHLCEETWNYRALLSAIKGSLKPKCQNFHEFHGQMINYMDTVRDKCPYSCGESFEKLHVHEQHFICPMSVENSENEKIRIYNAVEFLGHMKTHYKDDLPKEEIVCPFCQYEVTDGGHFLSLAYHMDQRHSKEIQTKKCIYGQDCGNLTFKTAQSWTSHYFAFHINDKDTLLSVLPALCEATKVRPAQVKQEDAGKNQSDTDTEEESDDKEAADNEDGADDSEDYDAFDVPDRKEDKPKGFGGEFRRVAKENKKKEEKAKLSTKKNNPKGQGEYVCENEEHETKPHFKTADMLELHIVVKHQCPVFKCHFSTMMVKDMVKHYKQNHADENKVCTICGASVSDLEQHKKDAHPECSSCLKRFDTLYDLQKHEVSCEETRKLEKEKKKPLEFLGKPDTSLNLDSTDTERLFNDCLLKLLDTSNLTQEEKTVNAQIIKRHTSEQTLARNRLRNDALGVQRIQNLLFEIPVFATEASAATSVTKASSLLGQIRATDIFDGRPKDAAKNCIKNFEKIEVMCRRLHTVSTLCSLTEAQAKCFLASFLSQGVIDILAGYTRRELHELSFKEVIQTLQNIFVPVSLDTIEQRVYSYKPEANMCLFEFASLVERHLSIVSRRLPEKDRDQYVEDGIGKILRNHLPPSIARIVESKETLYTKFSSSEILDIYASHNNKAHNTMGTEEQYNIFATAGSVRQRARLRDGDGWDRQRGRRPEHRGQRGRGGARRGAGGQARGGGQDRESRVHEVQRAPGFRGRYQGSRRPGGARSLGPSEESLKKIEMLGPKYKNKLFCFTCLDLDNIHMARNCRSGLEPSDQLCYQTVDGKKVPHGFHSQCKKFQDSGEVKNVMTKDNNRGRGKPSWGPR